MLGTYSIEPADSDEDGRVLVNHVKISKDDVHMDKADSTIASVFGISLDKQPKQIPASKAATFKKLKEIVFEQCDFEDISIEAIIALIRLRTPELDPDKKGITIINKIDKKEGQPADKFTMSLDEISVGYLFSLVALKAGLECQIDDNGAVIISKKKPDATPVPNGK